MKVDKIVSTNFKSGIVIKMENNALYRRNNSQSNLLYNDVLDLVQEYHIPSKFESYQIKLLSGTEKILDKLKNFNIVYNEIV